MPEQTTLDEILTTTIKNTVELNTGGRLVSFSPAQQTIINQAKRAIYEVVSREVIGEDVPKYELAISDLINRWLESKRTKLRALCGIKES